ncbi:unnamed protein product [Adineta steineri]|uniref:Uncharacterized protein n=2 Tax=Adineta steineri TaxID=433720 RepID=A0A814X8U5_9BILA|nr:unnamed protein product [Adineta steineri]CAF1211662.1 unnamed protein product [Adineta steineri]CAF1363323.1 unnamed protein product [Adineta steineri]CAF3702982.1 unnamed protein product [Adineta steineri]
MFTKFIFLLTITIFAVKAIDSNEDSLSSLDEDAEKWTELQNHYITQSPYESVRGDRRTRCRMIHECCPEERKHLFKILSEGDIQKTCTGTAGSSLYESHSPKCRSLIQHLSDIRKSTEYAQLMEAYTGIQVVNARFQVHRTKMASVCSTAELSAFYCEPENMTLFKSCAKKVLRLVDRENGGRGYDKFFRLLKDDYKNINERIAIKFPYLS